MNWIEIEKDNQMKLLTVTVPCYNSQDYMANCIESLLPGSDRVEIIVINDGSKDNTGAIADEYAAKYPNIVRVIHQENGGHGEGINQGLRHATGKYFKVVDSDDKVSEDFPAFLDMLEECEKTGGVDLFVTNYYYVHTDGIGDRSINYSNALPEHKVFGWSEKKDCLTPVADFDAEKDIQLFTDVPQCFYTVREGQFSILFPEDGHAPMLGEGRVKKCIFKILL